MDRSAPRELVKHIVTRVPCGVCSQPFGHEDIETLGRRGDVWLLAVHCTHCETRGLIFAQMQVEEGARYESELQPYEWEWFESLEPVGVDDVLDAHRFLREFGGDVYDLLGMRRHGRQGE